jgi:hypothetical protein
MRNVRTKQQEHAHNDTTAYNDPYNRGAADAIVTRLWFRLSAVSTATTIDASH